MNDKDKEAFDYFWEYKCGINNEDCGKDDVQIVWQAACEYKDKALINGTRMKQMNERIEELLEENTKLRECVEFYADRKKWSPVYEGIHKYKTLYKVHRTGSKRARQVLKELDE